jgi:hypothetical protein
MKIVSPSVTLLLLLGLGCDNTLNSPLPEGRGFHGSRRRFPASTGG